LVFHIISLREDVIFSSFVKNFKSCSILLVLNFSNNLNILKKKKKKKKKKKSIKINNKLITKEKKLIILIFLYI